MKGALAYLGIVNLVAFLAFGWDKWAARRRARRVPEARLLLLAACLGSPGAWLGVRAFRHKTSKRSFRLRLAAVTVLNAATAALVVWFWFRGGSANG